MHDPAKILLGQVLSLAIGGDALADVDPLRAQPGVFGPAASNPTISWLVKSLADAAPAVLAAINATRAEIRARVWDAAPTYKRGFGYHPLASFIDHGGSGTGEPLAMALQPASAGSNTAADHISVTGASLAHLSAGRRAGRGVLIPTDSAGAPTVSWIGSPIRCGIWPTRSASDSPRRWKRPFLASMMPAGVRALNSDGVERDGAWVTELTGFLDLSAWPAGMRVIVRKEVPHVGAQLRITDIDGMRYTAFATNQAGERLAGLEVVHRLRARREDRMRNSKDAWLANLPLSFFASNEIWVHLVMMAVELTAFTQMLALTGTPARCFEPKRLRARVFETAGKIISSGQRRILHLASAAPETPMILAALDRLRALAVPTDRGHSNHPDTPRNTIRNEWKVRSHPRRSGKPSHPDARIGAVRQRISPDPHTAKPDKRSRLDGMTPNRRWGS